MIKDNKPSKETIKEMERLIKYIRETLKKDKKELKEFL